MADRLHTYTAQVVDPAGTSYRVSADGEEREDGLWEGWLVFEPVGHGEALRTGRETTQPNRADLEYWASGLEAVYLEGALARARPESAPGARG